MLGIGACFGEEGVKAVFLPGTSSEPAKVLFTETKMLAEVISVFNGQPPPNCPDGSFWTKDQNSLVSCKDGVTFKLAPLNPSDKYYDLYSRLDAMKLQKIKGGTETDENPPMRSDQKKGVKP
ncbi:hypothetical protein A9K72_25685 [Mesorhizobium loti]|nr:hypothetical protein A9K72_25685 [Mesorhizobium loti]